MASTMSTLADRIRTVLRGIDATGSYTYNLSIDADQVDYGDSQDRTPPAVRITSLGLDSAEAVTLTRYSRTVTVNLIGWVPVSADNPGERMKAASDLANDIHLAIEADRIDGGAGTLGVLTTSVVVESDVLDGNSLMLDGCGAVAARVTMSYRSTTGV